MSTAEIGFALTMLGFITIVFLIILLSMISEKSKGKREKLEKERLKIIETTYKDGSKIYVVEGKQYGYYCEVLKYQWACNVYKDLSSAKKELEKAKRYILTQQIIAKKEIKVK